MTFKVTERGVQIINMRKREKAVREKAVREKAVREKVVREKAVKSSSSAVAKITGKLLTSQSSIWL
jgi:pimeloyl-CoA synthetase